MHVRVCVCVRARVRVYPGIRNEPILFKSTKQTGPWRAGPRGRARSLKSHGSRMSTTGQGKLQARTNQDRANLKHEHVRASRWLRLHRVRFWLLTHPLSVGERVDVACRPRRRSLTHTHARTRAHIAEGKGEREDVSWYARATPRRISRPSRPGSRLLEALYD